MLRAGLRGKRLSLSDDERRRLAVKAQALGREALAQIASVATPATLLRLSIVKTAPPKKSRTYASLEFRGRRRRNSAAMLDVVVFLISLGVRVIRAMCRRRADLVLENVALRQQVTALKKERPRPPLEDTERAFWVALRGSWPVWASRLLIVHADTVARWHRDRFRRYWAKMSQYRHPGRPVLLSLSVGEMTLRLYGVLSYSQNSVHDLRCVLNGA